MMVVLSISPGPGEQENILRYQIISDYSTQTTTIMFRVRPGSHQHQLFFIEIFQ